MDHENLTSGTNVLLLGLAERPELQTALFILFLTMYLFGIVSNSAIVTAIATDNHLYTPMYFFIGNLSLVEMCLTTTTVPQFLANIISKSKIISFSQCITQIYFYIVILCIDNFLLGIMAYDRYVAICNPLHYLQVMDKKACILLVICSWALAFMHSFLHTLMTMGLTFCKNNVIQNICCNLPALLKLSCSDTSLNELLIRVEAIPLGIVSIFSIAFSYARIIYAVMRIRSSSGRHKTFSTCSSHLIVVSFFYGTILFNYTQPTSSLYHEKEKVVTVMYTVVIPMLNPIIYGLRNESMKGALKKILWSRHFS